MPGLGHRTTILFLNLSVICSKQWRESSLFCFSLHLYPSLFLDACARQAEPAAASARKAAGGASGSASTAAVAVEPVATVKEPPLPMTVLETLAPYNDLIASVELAFDKCRTEKEFETMDAKHTKQKTALKALLGDTRLLRTDMTNRDRAAKSADSHSVKRKAASEEKSSSGKASKKAAAQNMLLVDYPFAVNDQMLVFKSLEELKAHGDKCDLLFKPWLLRGGAQLQGEFRNDATIKTQQQAFMHEFLGSGQEKKTGRATWFLEAEQSAALSDGIKEKMQAFTPKSDVTSVPDCA